MQLHTLGPGAKFNGGFDFQFFVMFDKIEGLEREQARTTLNQFVFVQMVQRIVCAIEAECRRLGFCQ